MNGWGWRGGWLLAVGSSLLSAVCQGELGHRIGLGRMEREGRDSDLVMELNTGAVSSPGTGSVDLRTLWLFMYDY